MNNKNRRTRNKNNTLKKNGNNGSRNHALKRNNNPNRNSNRNRATEENNDENLENLEETGSNQAPTTSDNQSDTEGKLTLSTKTKIKIASGAIGVGLIAFAVMVVGVYITSIAGTVTSSIGAGFDNSTTVPVDRYYQINCSEVKVNSVSGSQSGTFALEDYVAGVVNAEVGMMNNEEIYKAFAIAARTYFLYNNGSTCSIDNSESAQTFKQVSSSTTNGNKILQAVANTEGQVLLDDYGNLINAQYDAFCTTAVDSEYYTVKQKNQKVPRTWADSQSGIKDDWKKGEEIECHGNGASQWGAYYLAEKGANAALILKYYYLTPDSSVSISSRKMITSVDGLDVKTTTGSNNTLNKSIATFLQEKGSSLSTYNEYIKNNVTNAGVGTREGVVVAAVSMINYLYDNYGIKLPYYWGGYSMDIGIPSSFGQNSPSNPSTSGKIYQYKSFDCSGFVSWAIRNGGYKFTRLTSTSFDRRFGQYGCNITQATCKGQPGDLINSIGHVKMIVSVDEANNNYYVAESTTRGVLIQTQNMHTPMSGETKILHMDNFYNNPDNVDPNY